MYEAHDSPLPSLRSRVGNRFPPGSGTAPPLPLVILGETAFRGQRKRFGIRPQDRLRHTYLLGKTGTGKSTLIASMVIQDLEQGTGLALLDPHGDLVEAVLPFVPAARRADVLLFAPEDEAFPISFNVFRQGRRQIANTGLLASQLVSVFKHQWSDSWGPRLEHVLRLGILAVAESPEATLLLLYRFLAGESVRTKVLEQVKDPLVRAYWEDEFPGYSKSLQREILSPVLNKLGAFVTQRVARHIVGQVRSRVDLGELMKRRGILLAKLPAGQVGEDVSHLLGGLLVSSLTHAALARGPGAPGFTLYVDEFQHFVSDALPTVLSEARKFGLGLVLAHQYLGQLPHWLQDAVLGNIGTTVLFRLGALDAQKLEPEFFPPYSHGDLSRLPNHHVALKLLIEGTASEPFAAQTLPPRRPPADAAEVVEQITELSRQRFAKPRGSVEDALRLGS